MFINVGSILKKVKDYAGTSACKAKTKACIDGYRENGKSKTDGGGVVVTDAGMMKAADILIEYLIQEAADAALPQSVRDHFDSLAAGLPKSTDSGYLIDIEFTDDLSRMSLLITSGSRAGERTGEGIENIVSLFDAGYSAEKTVYGVWEGHGSQVIASRSERQGKFFIERAIERFNRDWGEIYRVVAVYTPEVERSLYS